MLKTLSKLFDIVVFLGLTIYCMYVLSKDTATLKEVADLVAITLVIVLTNQANIKEIQEKIK